MKLIRISNWSLKLSEYLATERPMPYTIGTNDCVHFCLRAVQVITGTDLSGDSAVQSMLNYTNTNEIENILKDKGGLLNIISSVLGPALGPNNARRGDLVYFEPDPGKEAVGVCTVESFCLPGDKGLEHIPMKLALASWRIG